ncbi:MAG TPA: polymer-forming cytoskeletal protein [Acidobacteriota bacterium]|nr:polymer-forming cytoskeletal protein [Acidobacteriota bacterium]
MLFKKGKSASDTVSYLDKGAELTGEFTFTNGVTVNGVIKGKIRSEAILEIGPAGKIDGEAAVLKVSIRGEFRGTLYASDRVEIHKGAKVFGNLYSPCLIIEAGAVFEGHCNMNEQVKPLKNTADGEKETVDSRHKTL